MMARFKLMLFSIALFILMANLPKLQAFNQHDAITGGGELTAVQNTVSSVSLSWTTTDAPFTVNVINQATSQIVQSFNTSNTYATVFHLGSGVHYTFTVTGTNSIIIADDLLML